MTHPHFLIPENAPRQRPSHDPYTKRGSANVIRDNRAAVIEMLRFMEDAEPRETFLALSPCRKAPWLAAAMKTSGLIDEDPSENGACRLVLAEDGRRALAGLRAREVAA